MSILVTYQSKTGFTKKYAEWISNKLKCDLKETSTVSASDIKSCRLVIHGGWIMGGTVNGLDKIKSFNPQKLIVFGVGLSKKEQTYIDNCIKTNNLGSTPFYYYEGGINPGKMGFIEKTIIKIVTKKPLEYTDNTDEAEIKELVTAALSIDKQ